MEPQIWFFVSLGLAAVGSIGMLCGINWLSERRK